MTEHLVSYLRNALARADEGVVTFEHLSDEETAVIESEDASDLTVRPWMESQKHLDAASASLFGRRSLYLRGLLRRGIDEHTGLETLVLSDELRLVADARRLGVAYAVAVATHRGERTARNNALQPQIGTFEEDIDTDGFHHFSACTYRTALHRLADWTLPNGGDHAGEIRTEVTASRWQRWVTKQLGADARTVEINIFAPDGTGSYAGEQLRAAHAGDTAVLSVAEGKTLRVASATTSQLEYQLAERISTLLGVRI